MAHIHSHLYQFGMCFSPALLSGQPQHFFSGLRWTKYMCSERKKLLSPDDYVTQSRYGRELRGAGLSVVNGKFDPQSRWIWSLSIYIYRYIKLAVVLWRKLNMSALKLRFSGGHVSPSEMREKVIEIERLPTGNSRGISVESEPDEDGLKLSMCISQNVESFSDGGTWAILFLFYFIFFHHVTMHLFEPCLKLKPQIQKLVGGCDIEQWSPAFFVPRSGFM